MFHLQANYFRDCSFVAGIFNSSCDWCLCSSMYYNRSEQYMVAFYRKCDHTKWISSSRN
ncbi:unnamed protein product [Larinioides sclopetarius]|uniref:Uncharacterized protein n=1 Tax=Larinioides sclopetarius TaxID=280406 RepID=A0AAV1Z948_9ARAC